MSLAAGARIGSYEVLAPVGAGGMGEVYKARDTRLDRTVAIKVLPETLAADPHFRERFDREARALSQLTHPHICTLYDVGEQRGTAFLVMEYLEGETLEHRLRQGALPIDQALQNAIQMADALDGAHQAGIVHRDLKPANILLTKAGVKLVDFGLAKTDAAVSVAPAVSMAPTTSPNLTAQGTILGTLQYMAPEQLEGHEADRRTDIFAFGTIVYEMITGKKAFAGNSQASLISAIMSSDPPPIATSQPLTPPALDRVVKKCLEKERGERWQSAKDLDDELRWRATRPVERSLIRLDVDLGSEVALAAIDSGNPISISPDGMRLAYAASVSGGQTRLFTRGWINPGPLSSLSPSQSPRRSFRPTGSGSGSARCAGSARSRWMAAQRCS